MLALHDIEISIRFLGSAVTIELQQRQFNEIVCEEDKSVNRMIQHVHVVQVRVSYRGLRGALGFPSRGSSTLQQHHGLCIYFVLLPLPNGVGSPHACDPLN